MPAKVDGSASFGIDAQLPGMKYATVKASPVFGANVKSVNETSVQDMPGVRKVVNLGNAVAIIADGYWQARQALGKIDVVFEESGNETVGQSDIFEQFTSDMDTAIANGDEIVDFETGDVNAAMASAARTVAAEYRVPYLSHAKIGRASCRERV